MLAEKVVQVTNEEQHIVWEGYGLRLHIPPNSLPEDLNQCSIKIEVALSGNFQLPEDGVLVSAIYSFSHDLGDKELRRSVTLEMQHCANASVLNDLCVVRAVGAIHPCKFEKFPGADFNRSDGYGAINLRRFSIFSEFVRRVRSFFSPFEYIAKLYYTTILPCQFDFEFLIIRDLDALAEVRDVHVCVHVYMLLIVPLTIIVSLCCRLSKQSFEKGITSLNMDPLQKSNLKGMRFPWLFLTRRVMDGV